MTSYLDVIVRQARLSDREPVIGLLSRTFPRVPAERWDALFAYPWLTDPPDYGFLVEKGGEVVAFMGAIYSDRVMNGRTVRVCSVTSWCVREDQRGRVGARLADTFLYHMRDHGIPILVLSAGPHILNFLRRRGFAPFRRFKDVRYGLPPGGALIRGRLPRWIDPAGVTVEQVGEEAFRILQHHRDSVFRVRALAVDSDVCVLVTRHRTVAVGRPSWAKGLANRGYGRRGTIGQWVNRARDVAAGTISSTEIVYASDREFVRRHLRAIAFRIAMRDHTVAISGDEGLLGFPSPSGEGEPDEYLIAWVPPDLGPSDFDPLYSELVVLGLADAL